MLWPLNISTREPVGASAPVATSHPCHGSGDTAARGWAIVPAQGREVRILASLGHVVSSQPPALLLWPEHSWADNMQVSMCGSAPARLLSTEQVAGGLGPRSCGCRDEGAAPPACGGCAACAGSRPGGLGLPVPGHNWPRCPARELLAPPGASQAAGGGGDLGHLVTGRSELWATISCFDPRPQQAHIWTLSSGAGLDSLSPRPLLGALPPQQQGARGAPLLMRTSAEAGLLQTAGGDDSSGWASEAQPDLAPLGAPLPVVDAPRAGASRPPHSCALSAAGGVGPEPVGAVTGGGQVASLGPRCFTLRPFRMQHG